MAKLTLLILISICLGGCGGGGESSSATPPVSETVSDDTNTDTNADGGDSHETGSDTDTLQPLMADLTVDEEFTFSTKLPLAINVDLNMGEVRAYLNICQKNVDGISADYTNCLYRSPLNNGQLDTSITLSRSDIELVAEIWFYDTSTDPLRYNWQFDETSELQAFEIN